MLGLSSPGHWPGGLGLGGPAEPWGNSPCNAGFAYDTAVRAIKGQYNGEMQYDEIGRPGVSFGGSESRECLGVRYQDGVELLIYTVSTPEQLGVLGN